jgi:hypothetical protein
MQKKSYKKEYMEAVKKKTNDIQRSKENNRGCVGITSDVADGKDGKAAGVVKTHN